MGELCFKLIKNLIAFPWDLSKYFLETRSLRNPDQIYTAATIRPKNRFAQS